MRSLLGTIIWAVGYFRLAIPFWLEEFLLKDQLLSLWESPCVLFVVFPLPLTFCFKSKITHSGTFCMLKSFGFQLCTFETLKTLNEATKYGSCCVLLFPGAYKIVFFFSGECQDVEGKSLHFCIPLDSFLPFKTLIIRNGPLSIFNVLRICLKGFLLTTAVSLKSCILAPDTCP